MIPFQTIKKDPASRKIWINLVNRLKPGSKSKLFEPGKDSRICSAHFKDLKPTKVNPYPTQNLGYDATRKLSSLSILTPRSSVKKMLNPLCFTPKDLELQSATWSEYKHHNTVKFLISVTPNSFITFMSEPYTGRISDKAITIDSNYLDSVSPYSRIMADKGFNISKECASNRIYLTVPPGKRGISQMTPQEIKKTSQVAKVRILVEQVIRRVKTFRIIANELPLTLLPHLHDILIICAALANLKNPIMKI